MLRIAVSLGLVLFINACAAGPAAREASGGAAASPEQQEPSREQRFRAWLDAFRADAARAGIDDATLTEALDAATLKPRVIELDRSQPEFTQRIWEYMDTAVSPQRIERGREQLARHAQAAESAARTYGVRPEILVAIWGLETNYGSNLGGFSIIDALATLGFEGRRSDFARRQLMAALEILASGDVERARMRGSWAGAMGQTQFLPTSFQSYAVDTDGDGRRDIWDSIPDALASTANYLAESGWRSGQPWGVEVQLPDGFDYAQSRLDVRKSSRQWAERGVSRVSGGESLPAFDSASVITPAGARGPAFLVGPNFRVIMDYNAAISYALAAVHLADRIDGGAAFAGSWPRGLAAMSREQIKTMQRLLNQQGFDAGTPDGIMGPNTRSGLRAFQRSRGLAADGYPTFALLELLREGA